MFDQKQKLNVVLTSDVQLFKCVLYPETVKLT